MATQAVTSITCPNCGNPFTAPVYQIIDAQEDPAAKSRLLAGQPNTVICPNCGFQGALNTPFLYHDAELELALIYMPMEVGPTDAERQKAIGDLTNRLMQDLPPEARKGYLLQPQTFLSVQSLVDALLERDHETRELVEAQRRKVELIDQLRQIDPDDSLALAQFVGANDEAIDETFFQLLDIMISIAESQGESAEHARLVQHQDALLEKTTTGQRFKAQQEAVEALSADPTRDTLVELLVAAQDRDVREALITVGRGLLDYSFFQSLTARIDEADTGGDQESKGRLVALRKEVQEIRDEVDAMAMAVMDARAQLLRDVLVADDPREVLTRHLLEIDATFLAVLNTNIQQAAGEGRSDLAERLREIGDIAISVLNEHAPPEVRLVNQLVTAEDNDQVDQILEQHSERLDPDVLEVAERVLADVQQTPGDERGARLQYIVEQIRERLAGEKT